MLHASHCSTFHLSLPSNASEIACCVSHSVFPSLFHSIIQRPQEHLGVGEPGMLDNELCVLVGIETAES